MLKGDLKVWTTLHSVVSFYVVPNPLLHLGDIYFISWHVYKATKVCIDDNHQATFYVVIQLLSVLDGVQNHFACKLGN